MHTFYLFPYVHVYVYLSHLLCVHLVGPRQGTKNVGKLHEIMRNLRGERHREIEAQLGHLPINLLEVLHTPILVLGVCL